MRLIAAEGALLESILDQTYPLWNEGLSREAYGQWNAAQRRTRFGRDRLQRFALVDTAGRWLATAKRYRFDARLDGRDGVIGGLAAVFTPPELRGQGHATALIQHLVEQERADGAMAAALFSEIGAACYERRGFVRVPLDEVTVNVEVKAGSPAMLVRAGDERDLPDIARMNEIRAVDARFALRRTPALIHYAVAKKRLLAGLGPRDLRQLEFYVAEEGASAVAYVVLSVNANGWTLEEAGDRDPAGARLGAMLQVLVAREPSQRVPLIRAWWPRSFRVPPQLRLSDRVSPRDVLLLRPFVDLPAFTAPEILFWHSDHF
jgi:GNAT superfamily N-acetyltransferase